MYLGIISYSETINKKKSKSVCFRYKCEKNNFVRALNDVINNFCE